MTQAARPGNGIRPDGTAPSPDDEASSAGVPAGSGDPDATTVVPPVKSGVPDAAAAVPPTGPPTDPDATTAIPGPVTPPTDPDATTAIPVTPPTDPDATTAIPRPVTPPTGPDAAASPPAAAAQRATSLADHTPAAPRTTSAPPEGGSAAAAPTAPRSTSPARQSDEPDKTARQPKGKVYGGESPQGSGTASPQLAAPTPAAPQPAIGTRPGTAPQPPAGPSAAAAAAQPPIGPPFTAGTARPSGATVYGRPAQPAGPSPADPATAGRVGSARVRPRWPRVLLVGVLLLLLIVGGTVQLTRALPDATLSTDIAATLRIPGKAPTLPWPKRGSAELMIEGLGRLGGSGGDDPAPIGSVAKVMTAYVILEEHPLTGDEEGPTLTITAADVADYQSRIATNQSQVPIKVGERLTERDALEALMLPSANNIAHKLAVWDAGSEAAFLDKMNAAAAELGMTATRYTDPSGFLPTTTSTAADQVALARAALRSDVFAEIVAMESATIPVAGKIKNYNDLLGVQGVFGIKTGSTDEAGGNLVFASRLTVGGRRLTVVGAVFNQPGANTPEQLDAVNREVRALLRTVRKVVREYPLLAAEPVGRVSTGWDETTTVRPAKALTVVGWPGLTVPVEVTEAAPGPTVTGGEVVGSVRAAGVRVDLRADEPTDEPSLWWRLTRF